MVKKRKPETGRPRKPRPAADTLRGQLAHRLESLRESRGLSQPALAEAAGVGLGTVQRIEAGDCEPKLETVAAIAEALGLRPRELMAACEKW